MTEQELPGGPLPQPDDICDGGDLDCGSGLLLIIRSALEPLSPGGILEIRSREISVKEDLPAWCRMVGHQIVATEPGEGQYIHYSLRKKGGDRELSSDLDAARAHEWRVRVRWQQGMQSKVYARNHSWTIGQPASFDTEDAAASAVEHLLGALASCLVVGFQWRCSKQSIEVFNLEVTITAKIDNVLVFLGLEDTGHPGLSELKGRVYMDANAEESTLTDIWRETVKRSPIYQSLTRTVPVSLEMSKV